jgi:hypothetical protein
MTFNITTLSKTTIAKVTQSISVRVMLKISSTFFTVMLSVVMPNVAAPTSTHNVMTKREKEWRLRPTHLILKLF